MFFWKAKRDFLSLGERVFLAFLERERFPSGGNVNASDSMEMRAASMQQWPSFRRGLRTCGDKTFELLSNNNFLIDS